MAYMTILQFMPKDKATSRIGRQSCLRVRLNVCRSSIYTEMAESIGLSRSRSLRHIPRGLYVQAPPSDLLGSAKDQGH